MFAKYADYYSLFRPEAKDDVKFVYEWAGRPKWIFDIGCGRAEYWKYFPKRVNIFGIDQSQEMIKDNPRAICADIMDYKHEGKFDCVTAFFDVMNYIPKHNWWKDLPLESGGYFILDVWNKEKVDKEGFKITKKKVGSVVRGISPDYDGKKVSLAVTIFDGADIGFTELHTMYVYSHDDILNFAGDNFEVQTKETETWQKWYKLKRK